jgi:hypothetical protein
MRRTPEIILALALSYVVAYLGMTLGGGYIPFTSGTNGIKDWIWKPKYFIDDTGRFRRGVCYAFLPLFWLDTKFWHDDWTGTNGPRRTLKPPAYRLGLVRGAQRELVMHQLEQVHATIMTNTPELLRAEYKTADSKRPIQVELTFREGQVASIHYIFL